MFEKKSFRTLENEIPSPVIFSLEGATGKHGPVSEYPRALSVVTDRRKRKQSAVKHMHVK